MRDWECIVIDDGSSDDSVAAANSVSDSRIRVVSQRNQGPGAARNRGVELARAPLVAFLDADDDWDPKYLAHHLDTFEKNPEIAASVSGHRRVGSSMDVERHFRESGISDGLWTMPANATPEEVKLSTDFMHSGSVVLRRDVFFKYGGFYAQDRCTYGEDTHLWIQIVASEILWRTPCPLMNYHVEDSCLGVGRKTSHPPWPMLFHPTDILTACKPDIRPILQSAFHYYALLAANRYLAYGRLVGGLKLISRNLTGSANCPGTRRARKRFLKLLFLQPWILLRRIVRKCRLLFGAGETSSVHHPLNAG